jgi:hypothetical protein
MPLRGFNMEYRIQIKINDENDIITIINDSDATLLVSTPPLKFKKNICTHHAIRPKSFVIEENWHIPIEMLYFHFE